MNYSLANPAPNGTEARAAHKVRRSHVTVHRCVECGMYWIVGCKHFDPNRYSGIVALYAKRAEKNRNVSHGYCPSCAPVVEARMLQEIDDGTP